MQSQNLSLPSVVPYVLAWLVKDNKLLLAYRSNTFYGNEHYGLIGGKVEEHESFTQALARELQEELAITVKEADINFIHLMHFKGKTRPCIAVVFVINKWQGEPINKEPQKHDHISWFSLDNLPSNIIPIHALIINYIKENQNYAEAHF